VSADHHYVQELFAQEHTQVFPDLVYVLLDMQVWWGIPMDLPLAVLGAEWATIALQDRALAQYVPLVLTQLQH
jgi:hypothetical protein